MSKSHGNDTDQNLKQGKTDVALQVVFYLGKNTERSNLSMESRMHGLVDRL